MLFKTVSLPKTLCTLSILVVTTLTGCHNTTLQKQNEVGKSIYLDNTYNESAEIKAYIQPFKDSLDKEMKQIIGHAKQRLNKGMPESLLTNFTADLLLEESIKTAKSESLEVPDIAIINHKGLRTIIDEGPITVEKIYQLMPFENKLVLVTLSKDQLVELFNYMASVGGDGLSGATFTIKDGKAQNIKVNGKALTKANYIIATNDYLAKGGDKFTIFTKALSQKETHAKLRDLIIDHIKTLEQNNQMVDAKLDNRITL